MKNVQVYIEREDIHAKMRSLWRTDLFRRSHDDPDGFIHKVVDRYADLPRFIYEPSDEKNEKAHFSSWWGGLEMREYNNDFIHDLYMLHEIRHSGEMVYIRDMAPENFLHKMVENELDASVCSEIAIYFEFPELRGLVFPHPIFADRLLADQTLRDRWTTDKQRVWTELEVHRRNAMVLPAPANDMAAFWVNKFARQNEAWGAIWTYNYSAVETAMADLRDDCRTIGRQAAMDKYMAWLQSPAITKGTAIPFPDEAEAFSKVYWLNMGQYSKAFNGPDAQLLQKKFDDAKGSGPKLPGPMM